MRFKTLSLQTLALLGAVLLVLPTTAFAATENITHKTAIGEVTSFDGERLTVMTDNGSYYFDVEVDTLYPEELSVGDIVAVDFEMGEERDGVFIAQEVRLDDRDAAVLDRDVDVAEVEVTEPVTTTTVAEVEIPEPRPTLPLAPAPQPDLDIETRDTVVADLDTDTEVELEADLPEVDSVRASLPATGSSLPLLGLGGLVALLGAGVLRFFS